PRTHRTALLWHRDRPLSREVLAGQRPFGPQDTRWRTEIDHFATVLASARSQIQDTVALADDFRVVLDHNNSVLVLLQMVQYTHQPTTVARVQANARFVQDIQGIDQGGAQRRGEVD